MTDHLQEQEMEIEALEAILMDEFQEIHPSESGLNTSNRCFQITLSPQEDETDESSTTPAGVNFRTYRKIS
ncbi:putative RWD domain-containing protein [Helianthus annuus]|nr:putative RWD domain-containing protein [Helianthus annuus]